MRTKDTTVSDSQSKTAPSGTGAPPPTSRSPSCSRCGAACSACCSGSGRGRRSSGAWSLPGGYLGTGDTLERSIRAHLARKVDVAELSLARAARDAQRSGPPPRRVAARHGLPRPRPARRSIPRSRRTPPGTRSSGCPRSPSTTRRSCSPAASACAPSSPTRTSASPSRPGVLDLRAQRDLHRRARLRGRPHQPAPRARAPRRCSRPPASAAPPAARAGGPRGGLPVRVPRPRGDRPVRRAAAAEAVAGVTRGARAAG